MEEEKDKVHDLTITVSEPHKKGEGMNAFMTYRVRTKVICSIQNCISSLLYTSGPILIIDHLLVCITVLKNPVDMFLDNDVYFQEAGIGCR